MGPLSSRNCGEREVFRLTIYASVRLHTVDSRATCSMTEANTGEGVSQELPSYVSVQRVDTRRLESVVLVLVLQVLDSIERAISVVTRTIMSV